MEAGVVYGGGREQELRKRIPERLCFVYFLKHHTTTQIGYNHTHTHTHTHLSLIVLSPG